MLGAEKQRLGVDLGQTLGAAHHVAGIHSLVGRYHHKLVDAVFQCQVGNVACAHHVGEHCLGGVLLHHGHVLVGSSVEHIFRAIACKGSFHAVAVLDVAHVEHDVDVGKLLLHLEGHVVHRGFGLVYEHDFAGFVGGYLAHNLAAYRAAGAGDEHTRALDVIAHEHVVEHDGVAPQQILDLHFFHVGRYVVVVAVVIAVGLKLLHFVDEQQPYVVVDELVGKAVAHELDVVGTEDEGIDAVAHKDVGHRVGIVLIHLKTVDRVLALLVVARAQQTHRAELASYLVFERVGQYQAVERGAQHQHWLAPELRVHHHAVELLDHETLHHQESKRDDTGHNDGPETHELVVTWRHEYRHDVDNQQDDGGDEGDQKLAIQVLDGRQPDDVGVAARQVGDQEVDQQHDAHVAEENERMSHAGARDHIGKGYKSIGRCYNDQVGKQNEPPGGRLEPGCPHPLGV